MKAQKWDTEVLEVRIEMDAEEMDWKGRMQEMTWRGQEHGSEGIVGNRNEEVDMTALGLVAWAFARQDCK